MQETMTSPDFKKFLVKAQELVDQAQNEVRLYKKLYGCKQKY